MRWLVITCLLWGCEKSPPPAPAPCELALDIALGSYAYSARLTGRTSKLVELKSTLGSLSGESCTAIVTTDGATAYPLFVTLIEMLEDAGLHTAVAVGGGRLAVTTREAPGKPATTVVALKDERAYVNGTPIDDADVERGLVSALRRQPEVGLAADVSLRYATVERALRAARTAGTTLVLLETDHGRSGPTPHR